MTAPLVRGWEACDFNMSLHFHVAWHQQWSVALQFRRLGILTKRGKSWEIIVTSCRHQWKIHQKKWVSPIFGFFPMVVTSGIGETHQRSGGIMRNIVLYRCGYGTLDKWTFVWRAMQPIGTTRTEGFQYKDRCVFVIIILLYYTAIYTVPLLLSGKLTNLTVLIWACLGKIRFFFSTNKRFSRSTCSFQACIRQSFDLNSIQLPHILLHSMFGKKCIELP